MTNGREALGHRRSSLTLKLSASECTSLRTVYMTARGFSKPKKKIDQLEKGRDCELTIAGNLLCDLLNKRPQIEISTKYDQKE